MLTVCNYHYIRPEFTAKYPSIFGVTLSEFENQLLKLSAIGRFIHPDEMIQNADNIFKSSENFILITFDDGLKEQSINALPILDSLKIPALFFINSINHIERKVSAVHKIHILRSVVPSEEIYENATTFFSRQLTDSEKKDAYAFYRYDNTISAELKYFLNVILEPALLHEFIDGFFDNYFDEKEVAKSLYMNFDEVEVLAKKGYIGNHTHTHLPLGTFDDGIIREELAVSKKIIEDWWKIHVKFVAYPYGTKEAANERVGEIAKETGHEFGFTTKPGFNNAENNPLLLNRFDCNDLVGGKNYVKEFISFGN